MTNTQQKINEVCNSVRDLLLEKNRKYGDSALNPSRIFSKSNAVEQIKVRIDDKLSRISTSGTSDVDEDTLQDLIGYLVLLKIATEKVPFAATYEDVLEDAAHMAAAGQELLNEYGLSDVDDQPLDGGDDDGHLIVDDPVKDRAIAVSQTSCSKNDLTGTLLDKSCFVDGDWEWDDPAKSPTIAVSQTSCSKNDLTGTLLDKTFFVELSNEYGLSDVDDQPLDGGDDDGDWEWDPNLGPVELSSEEIDRMLINRDTSDSDPNKIIKVIEKRGFLLGVKVNGNTCILGLDGSCDDQRSTSVEPCE